MKKSKIYTRSGDEGSTGLVSGNRISKADSRIDLYGEVDELNSRIGFASSYLEQFPEEVKFIHSLQSALFDLGSNMACEFENRSKFKLPQVTEDLIKKLEAEIDRLDSHLEPLKNFILPGGTHATAALHLARTGARNVERKIIQYQTETKEELPANSIVFLNRMSDYFFVLARFIGKSQNMPEIAWKPQN